jgi:nicotinamide mononucleotide transporter
VNEFVEGFKIGLVNTPLLEWFAVLTGVLYVILAAKKSIWCWGFAFVSSSIFVYLCFTVQLYIESVLQLFYVVMAIVGWVMWNANKNKEEFVIKWPINFHLINLSTSLLIACLLGFVFDTYTNQANPYMDSFTTIFSLAATFMVTKRVLNNWLYWIVIDLVSIYLYASRDLHLSAVLYFLFTFLAVFGWFAWRKQFKAQQA